MAGGSDGSGGTSGSGGMSGSGGSGGMSIDAPTQCLGMFESCMTGGIPCCQGLNCSGNPGQCL
jgi:hypothetical protein